MKNLILILLAIIALFTFINAFEAKASESSVMPAGSLNSSALEKTVNSIENSVEIVQ